MTKRLELQLTGKEAALLVGASVTWIAYPLRDAHDSEVRRDPGRKAQHVDLHPKISTPWRWVRKLHGLDTRASYLESFDARAALSCHVFLTPDEVRLALLIVQACVREFQDDWGAFMAISPGALHRFPVTIDDLIALGAKLEGELSG